MTPLHPASNPRLASRPELKSATIILIGVAYWLLVANLPFWRGVLAGRPLDAIATWGFVAAAFGALALLQFALLNLLLGRNLVRPVLGLLAIAAAAASYFIDRYSVVLDSHMLRNALATHPAEAGELLTPALFLHILLVAGPPLLLLALVRVQAQGWRRALAWRLGASLVAVALGAGLLLAIYPGLSALMRSHKELRFLITPANVMYSGLRASLEPARAAPGARLAVGTDAVLGPAWQTPQRPVLFVMVVGETARLDNWGLAGYERQTTPELAQRPVIPFARTHACGTNTEVSLPCMFSRVGRRDYDAARIRQEESLLDVLRRAGLRVVWRDNQSGCKGVCDGVESLPVRRADHPELCPGDHCLDEALLVGLDAWVAQDARGATVLVMHQLGNHGPAYSRRYPAAFERWTPACTTTELRDCSRESVRNAYDNALLYTDALLARTIDWLAGLKGRDTALLYVSDHGESLGENNFYLHGLPYSIAPATQTEVPMLLWLSPGYAQRFGLDTECLRHRARADARHDHLFHSILGLLDVRTSAYEREWDYTADCRQPRPSA